MKLFQKHVREQGVAFAVVALGIGGEDCLPLAMSVHERAIFTESRQKLRVTLIKAKAKKLLPPCDVEIAVDQLRQEHTAQLLAKESGWRMQHEQALQDRYNLGVQHERERLYALREEHREPEAGPKKKQMKRNNTSYMKPSSTIYNAGEGVSVRGILQNEYFQNVDQYNCSNARETALSNGPHIHLTEMHGNILTCIKAVSTCSTTQDMDKCISGISEWPKYIVDLDTFSATVYLAHTALVGMYFECTIRSSSGSNSSREQLYASIISHLGLNWTTGAKNITERVRFAKMVRIMPRLVLLALPWWKITGYAGLSHIRDILCAPNSPILPKWIENDDDTPRVRRELRYI